MKLFTLLVILLTPTAAPALACGLVIAFLRWQGRRDQRRRVVTPPPTLHTCPWRVPYTPLEKR
jgi:hypothetical protein